MQATLRLIDTISSRLTSSKWSSSPTGPTTATCHSFGTVPGISHVLGYTIAAEIGDITRFATPTSCVATATLPPRLPVGRQGPPGSLAKNGPTYLRWALIEAATHAQRHPIYAERYRRTATRLGRQRGKKIARGPYRPPSHRGDLAHVDHRPTIRSGRRRLASGRMTAPYRIALPGANPPTDLILPVSRR